MNRADFIELSRDGKSVFVSCKYISIIFPRDKTEIWIHGEQSALICDESVEEILEKIQKSQEQK